MSYTTRTAKRSKKKTIYKNKKIILISFICIAVLLVSLLGYTISKLTYNKVYEGVYINNVDISGLTKEELSDKIPEIFDKRLSKTITLKIADSEVAFESLSLVPSIDVQSMTDTAFSYGRTKKILSRLGEIKNLKKNKVDIPFKLSFDENALQALIDKATKNLDVTLVPNSIDFGDDELIIKKGKAGNGVDFAEVKSSIEDCILNDKAVATANFEYMEPEEITYEYVMRFVAEKPIDASYTVENHRMKFTESKLGVNLDKKKLEKAVKDAKGDTIRVSAKIKYPEVSSEDLKSKIVADELGKFTSDYSSSSKDRASNIKLACEKINGYVLLPGEEFSYNEVVGPRTLERGFKIANVYVGNTTQPGIGGGICQVSSTMYNAVVFADLEITERRNHTLPVAYVPMGRDATVSYDFIDFKFKNNTSMPIEIRTTAENGINTVIIFGTDEHPNREIKIETSRTGTTAPKVVVEKDPELLVGTVTVKSKGSNGSSYSSYKVVYENGTEISRTHLANSVYAGTDRVEIHGTKKPEPEENPIEAEDKKPSEVSPKDTVPSHTDEGSDKKTPIKEEVNATSKPKNETPTA